MKTRVWWCYFHFLKKWKIKNSKNSITCSPIFSVQGALFKHLSAPNTAEGSAYLISFHLFTLLLLSDFSHVPLYATPKTAGIDGSPPGSSVSEILQVRTLERVAISFSNAC